jgi:hypothetical protein
VHSLSKGYAQHAPITARPATISEAVRLNKNHFYPRGPELTDDLEIAKHYREQAARLHIMAALLPGAELKANLRSAARTYEDFAEKLETPIRLMVVAI